MKHLNFSLTAVVVALLSAGVSVFCYSQLSNRQQTIVVEQKSPIQFTSERSAGPADFTYAAEVSAKLREAGIGTQVFVEKKKTKAKLDYANKLSIPYVIFLGEDEVATGNLTLKDMRTGEQMQAPVDGIIARVKENPGTAADEKMIVCGD